jgi:hypothetical protein
MTNEENERAAEERLAMRLTAVRRDERALEYMRVQTPEICLAAVRQKGLTEDNFKAFIQHDELLAAPLDEARKNRLNAFLASLDKDQIDAMLRVL